MARNMAGGRQKNNSTLGALYRLSKVGMDPSLYEGLYYDPGPVVRLHGVLTREMKWICWRNTSSDDHLPVNLIFTQGNAPVPTAVLSWDYSWPPQSPDSNPIKNMWQFIKQQYETKKIRYGVLYLQTFVVNYLKKCWSDYVLLYHRRTTPLNIDFTCHRIFQILSMRLLNSFCGVFFLPAIFRSM